MCWMFLLRTKSSDETVVKETPNPINVYEDDLKMRAAMYGVLFQAFADQVLNTRR
jgi:hypothetical protein